MEKKRALAILLALFVTFIISTVLVMHAVAVHPSEDILKNDLIEIANSVSQIERVYIDYWLWSDVCKVNIEYAPGLSDYEKVDLQYYVQYQLEPKWYIRYVEPNHIYCPMWLDGDCPPWPGFVIGELLVGVRSIPYAEIDLDPNTLNLKSKGEWITTYIELPEGYDVVDIDVSSILMNYTIPVGVEDSTMIGDYDSDGNSDLMVKFNRTIVSEFLLSQGTMYGNVTLTITGELFDGTPFEGPCIIKVLFPGDVDDDGDVDRYDYGLLAEAYGTSVDDVAYNWFADFNEDQNIDRYDYGILAEYYGKTAV